jgi:hypothetical protein
VKGNSTVKVPESPLQATAPNATFVAFETHIHKKSPARIAEPNVQETDDAELLP